MLIAFSVRNFKSFRDEATLDLRCPRGVAAGASPWDGNVQAVAGIYGANASGKTTFFSAIQTMADQVNQSYRRSAVVGDPFVFDLVSPGQPTRFSATFIAGDDVCYAYGFQVLNGAVVDEWAERYTTTRPTLLFERKGMVFKFGSALKGANQAVARTVQPSTLYLSAASAARHEGLGPLYGWFSGKLRTFTAGGHESLLGHVVVTLANDAVRRERLVKMLSRTDLGLTGLDLEKQDISDSDKEQWFTLAKEVARAITGEPAPTVAMSEPYQAFGVHHVGGLDWQLPLSMESAGTRAMLCHAFVIDEALRTGATMVFDEVDASLHPLLVRELVRTFQDRQLNPLQAQMVFTTHDVSLMDAGYGNGSQLSRDEIWLTQKDAAGRSTLVALADYNPRTRENIARRYMSGRYGGVPDYVEFVDPVLV